MSLYEIRKFVAPEFIFGAGSRRRVGHYARNMMARRAFVISDTGVIAAGWLEDVLADLAAVEVETVIFKDVSPNPRSQEVMAGAELYAREQCDVIVALGGGSVVDCAKAVGIVHTNGRHVMDFEGVDLVDVPGPPLICIPTTAGAAAEISQFCIISNEVERYKMAIISKTVVPDAALIDPETTLTMDPYLTACTGLDVLTHAIEAYVSTASSPIVDVHALAAIRLVWDNIENAVLTPNDLATRENMLLASTHAGLAFSNASLGAVHALAHSLGGFLDLPHGECNALLLEHVVRFNLMAEPERYRQIGEAMRLGVKGLSDRECARHITEALSAMRQRVGLVGGLAARGVRSADIHELSKHAINDLCIVTNPKRIELEDVKVIYGEAL